jgi:hypothetical protein
MGKRQAKIQYNSNEIKNKTIVGWNEIRNANLNKQSTVPAQVAPNQNKQNVPIKETSTPQKVASKNIGDKPAVKQTNNQIQIFRNPEKVPGTSFNYYTIIYPDGKKLVMAGNLLQGKGTIDSVNDFVNIGKPNDPDSPYAPNRMRLQSLSVSEKGFYPYNEALNLVKNQDMYLGKVPYKNTYIPKNQKDLASSGLYVAHPQYESTPEMREGFMKAMLERKGMWNTANDTVAPVMYYNLDPNTGEPNSQDYLGTHVRAYPNAQIPTKKKGGVFPTYQKGGHPGLNYADRVMAKEVTEKHKNIDWVKRGIDVANNKVDWKQGNSTHLMETFEGGIPYKNVFGTAPSIGPKGESKQPIWFDNAADRDAYAKNGLIPHYQKGKKKIVLAPPAQKGMVAESTGYKPQDLSLSVKQAQKEATDKANIQKLQSIVGNPVVSNFRQETVGPGSGLPDTDIRSDKYKGNPNSAFMGNVDAQKFHNDVIGMALPTPGIDKIGKLGTVMSGVKSVAKPLVKKIINPIAKKSNDLVPFAKMDKFKINTEISPYDAIAQKQPWQIEELPGLHLKSTMSNNPKGLHTLIAPKDGSINTENALKFIKNNEGEAKYNFIKNIFGDNILPKMDYNLFRKKIQDNLITLDKEFLEKNSNFGISSLKYPSANRKSYDTAIESVKEQIKIYENALSLNPKSTEQELRVFQHDQEALQSAKEQLVNNLNEYKLLPLENKTILFSNKNKFGIGSFAHDNPKETLGHAHFLIDAETPDVLTLTQMQSDAFQGTHRNMPNNIEDAVARLSRNPENELIQNEVENFAQKQLLDKNHQERYLQEIIDYAGKRGDMNKIRVPTPETAAKVQGHNWRPSSANDSVIKAYKESLNSLKDLNTNHSLQKELQSKITILEKYAEQPKTIKKLYGEEPKLITDGKGNTWYEFNIPDNFKKGKGEIKAFATTGAAAGLGTLGAVKYNQQQKKPMAFKQGGKLNHLSEIDKQRKGYNYDSPFKDLPQITINSDTITTMKSPSIRGTAYYKNGTKKTLVIPKGVIHKEPNMVKYVENNPYKFQQGGEYDTIPSPQIVGKEKWKTLTQEEKKVFKNNRAFKNKAQLNRNYFKENIKDGINYGIEDTRDFIHDFSYLLKDEFNSTFRPNKDKNELKRKSIGTPKFSYQQGGVTDGFSGYLGQYRNLTDQEQQDYSGLNFTAINRDTNLKVQKQPFNFLGMFNRNKNQVRTPRFQDTKMSRYFQQGGVLQVNGETGQPETIVHSGARIFSREHTNQLIKTWKSGNIEALGSLVVKIYNIQEKQKPEYTNE